VNVTIIFRILQGVRWGGRTKKCDQCVQCDRLVPHVAGCPVWRVRASSPIKRRTNYVGRPGSVITGVGSGEGACPSPDYCNKLVMPGVAPWYWLIALIALFSMTQGGVWGFCTLFTYATSKRQKTMLEAKKRLNFHAEL